ncbi:hypothetical protein [Priestia endophytica]|uniref:hypothetical protein n=1 Tax=Priestia endophytica TaxID=135735 RepID=UPI00124E23FA|nr:hypothetical protein [Priestia endophytica]KAB2496230.1 hypothetical protein F8155_01275 [Priestia endophytica]
MSQSLPFFILLVLSLLLTVFILWRKSNKRLLLLFLFIGGLAHLLDFFIMFILNSYVYKPHFVQNPYYDNMLGSLVSQTFVYPTAALIVVAYNWSIFRVFLLSFLFMGIETLFLSLDIYEHFWWKTFYTGIFMFIGFLIAKKWYEGMNKGDESKWRNFLTLYFVVFVISGVGISLITVFTSLNTLSTDFFSDGEREQIILATIYIGIVNFLYSMSVVYSANSLYTYGLLCIICAVSYSLIMLNILEIAAVYKLLSICLYNVIVLIIIKSIHNRLLFL